MSVNLPRLSSDSPANAYSPGKIILFGSHANGKPSKASDIDLLIVMDFDGSSARQSIKITSELGLVTPLDLVIRTPEQIRERAYKYRTIG